MTAREFVGHAELEQAAGAVVEQLHRSIRLAHMEGFRNGMTESARVIAEYCRVMITEEQTRTALQQVGDMITVAAYTVRITDDD